MAGWGKSNSEDITALEKDIMEKLGTLAEMKRSEAPEEVSDYTLKGSDGPVRLSELFHGHDDLIVIHNMGKSCPYCTLWADGFNGVRQHLTSRAGFALVSPDPVAIQQDFKQSRGWKFPVYSAEDSVFTKDMGFTTGHDDDPVPGMSTFSKNDGKIFRIASSPFGPMDPFAGIWHMFGLLENGADGWQPKYHY